MQREFEEIRDHFKTHKHARLVLKYDESLSHLIYAASDMLIIPSIFEPCGLTQVLLDCFPVVGFYINLPELSSVYQNMSYLCR